MTEQKIEMKTFGKSNVYKASEAQDWAIDDVSQPFKLSYDSIKVGEGTKKNGEKFETLSIGVLDPDGNKAYLQVTKVFQIAFKELKLKTGDWVRVTRVKFDKGAGCSCVKEDNPPTVAKKPEEVKIEVVVDTEPKVELNDKEQQIVTAFKDVKGQIDDGKMLTGIKQNMEKFDLDTTRSKILFDAVMK